MVDVSVRVSDGKVVSRQQGGWGTSKRKHICTLIWDRFLTLTCKTFRGQRSDWELNIAVSVWMHVYESSPVRYSSSCTRPGWFHITRWWKLCPHPAWSTMSLALPDLLVCCRRLESDKVTERKVIIHNEILDVYTSASLLQKSYI